MDDLKNALRRVESGEGDEAGGRERWEWETGSDEGSSSDFSIGSDLLDQLMVTSDGSSFASNFHTRRYSSVEDR